MLPTPPTSFGVVPGQTILPSNFSAAEVKQAQELVRGILQDSLPTIDFGRGTTMFNLAVRSLAMVYLASREEWDSLRVTQSLKAVLERPDLASNDVVDAILSNFQISRRPGAKAVGRVKVVMQKASIISISPSTVFTAEGGLNFSPTAIYRLSTDPQEINDLQIYETTGTQVYVLVPVVAEKEGAAWKIPSGTQLTALPAIPSSVTISAFGGFEGGSDPETNEDLINRIPEARAVRNLSSRISISSVLKELFPSVSDVTVQGAFDLAMFRNTRNIFRKKSAGFVDIYFRTAGGIMTGSDDIQASLVEISTENDVTKGIYSISVPRTFFPGYYFPKAVRPQGSKLGGYNITGETKALDSAALSSGSSLITGNDVGTIEEATYSSYQASTVFFEIEYDESLGTSPEDQFKDEITVSLEVGYMPLVREIQDAVLARNTGTVLADYLVRAMVPCIVQTDTIAVNGSSAVSAQDVKLAIHNYINGLPAGKPLRVDELVMKIRAVPEVFGVKVPFRIAGEIYSPVGSVIALRSNSDLSIPSRPDLHIVPENTAFFIEMSDINVSINIV